jgi:hypothetical protein
MPQPDDGILTRTPNGTGSTSQGFCLLFARTCATLARFDFG